MGKAYLPRLWKSLHTGSDSGRLTSQIEPIRKQPGEGNGTPLQYSCLENPMDGGTWWAAVHGVAKSQTRLSNFTFTFHFHALEKAMATHSSVLAWRIPGTGAWRAAVYGVAESLTQLKRLSRSSSSSRKRPSVISCWTASQLLGNSAPWRTLLTVPTCKLSGFIRR